MARFSQPRSAFDPEALAQLKPIFDDVWKELVSAGVFELPTLDEGSTRPARLPPTKLSQNLSGRLRTKWVGVRTDEVLFRDTAHGLLAWALATLIMATLVTLGSAATAGVAAAAASAPRQILFSCCPCRPPLDGRDYE